MDLQLMSFKFWFLLALALVEESSCLKGPWLTVPHVVKSGDTITLTCEYNAEGVDLYGVKWYRNHNEFYRYTPQDFPIMKTFFIQNIDISRSNATQVTLKNITKEQSGKYECEVSTDAPWFQTGSVSSTMVVIDIPSSDPTMTIDQKSVSVGTKLSANCLVPSSDPPANITWSINNELISGNNRTLETSSTSDGQSSGISHKINIMTEASDFIDGVLSLKCEANIYNLWKGTVEMQVKEEIPKKIAELTVSTTYPQESQVNEADSGKNI